MDYMDSSGDKKGDRPSAERGKHRTMVMKRTTFWIIAGFVILFLWAVSMPNYCRINPNRSMILSSGQDAKSASGELYSSEAVGGASAPMADRNMSGYAGYAESEASQPVEAQSSSIFSQPAFAQEASVPGVKLMIVYNGSLSLKVTKLKEAADAVIATLPKYDGYVSNMSENTAGTSQLVTITARVEAAKVMGFVTEVKKLGEVLSSNLTGDEVTEEFVDLQAQLAALRVSEARLKEMLSKSGKLSDLLEIERELANKQTTINEVTGRMRYLQDRSHRATIEITLQTEAPPPPATVLFSWDFGQVFQQAWMNLKYNIRAFLHGLIVMGVNSIFWIPLLAVIIFVLWLVWRWLRRTGVIAWEEEKKP